MRSFVLGNIWDDMQSAIAAAQSSGGSTSTPQVVSGVPTSAGPIDSILWNLAGSLKYMFGGNQASAYVALLSTQAGGSTLESNAQSGFPSTWVAINVWSRSGSIGSPWAPNNLEKSAASTADGWITISSGGKIQITDPRYAKMSNGHWVNRNTAEDLGVATSITSAPSHTIAGKAASDVEDATSALTGVAKDLAVLLYNFIKEVGADIDDVLKLAEFLVLVSEKVITGSFDELNPFKYGSVTYNFINDTSNEGPLRMLLLLVVLGPLAIFLLPLAAAFSQMNPLSANSMAAVIDSLRVFTSGIAQGESFFDIAFKVTQDVITALLGVPIGPATAVKIVYIILSGLPLPPVMAIIDAVLADPVAQQFIGKTVDLPAPVVDKWMPIAMSCLNASDASEWLSCLGGMIEQLFPGIVSGLSRFAVDLNDLRTVIQSAWETGGNLQLMLSTAYGARSGFGADLNGLTTVQAAMVGIGFFGVGLIAKAMGLDNADGIFTQTILPLLPAGVRTVVSSAYDVFRFTEQLIIEAGNSRAQLSSSDSPTGFTLYLLETFHDARWDVETAVSSLIADEFDPSPRQTRLFSTNIKRDAQGHFMVTPALKALWTKLELDFPRVKYQLAMLAAKLGISDGELLGTRTDLDGARAAMNISIPSLPKPVSYKVAPAVVQAQPQSKQGAQQGITGPASALSGGGTSSTSWALIAAAAAAGGAAGGPAGALLGAAAGVLLDQKES